MARPGGHAQPERVADQGGRAVQLTVERGLHREAVPPAGDPRWLTVSRITHDTSHVRDLDPAILRGRMRELGARLAAAGCDGDKAIIGVFDEGCMGMYNAIIADGCRNHAGVIYKERLSQSALYAGCRTASDDDEAQAAFELVGLRGGCGSGIGRIEADRLTDAQVSDQCRKQYIAALRIARSSVAPPSGYSTSRDSRT